MVRTTSRFQIDVINMLLVYKDAKLSFEVPAIANPFLKNVHPMLAMYNHKMVNYSVYEFQ